MSISVTVRSNGGLSRYIAQLAPKVDRAVESVATAIYNDAVGAVPVRTGQLRGSATKTRVAPAHWSVAFSAPYAVFVDRGTRYMRARPFLTQQAMAKAPLLAARVAAAVKGA